MSSTWTRRTNRKALRAPLAGTLALLLAAGCSDGYGSSEPAQPAYAAENGGSDTARAPEPADETPRTVSPAEEGTEKTSLLTTLDSGYDLSSLKLDDDLRPVRVEEPSDAANPHLSPAARAPLHGDVRRLARAQLDLLLDR